MSSTRLTSLMTLGALVLVAPLASAQGPAPLERGYGHVNLGVQATSHDLEQDTVFVIYDEPGRIQVNGSGGGGVLFDIGGGWRVWQRLYAGLSFTSGSNTEDAALNATVPHPSNFDEFRTVTGTTPGLKHSEQAVHLQAMWRYPVTTKFDVLVGGGPTFFSVESGSRLRDHRHRDRQPDNRREPHRSHRRARERKHGRVQPRGGRYLSADATIRRRRFPAIHGRVRDARDRRQRRWTSTSAGSRLALAGASDSDGP